MIWARQPWGVPADGYPDSPAARNEWIVSRRGERNQVDPFRAYAFMREVERGPDGTPWETATIFLTNRECPWRCAMCDLWRNTTFKTVPVGAIPKQIRDALEFMPATTRQLKLYNSGSFFDAGAIPAEDLPIIAAMGRRFERVVVECHPSLVGRAALEFAETLGTKLEIAMGLETAHPHALERLNKRMTLEDFRRAAEMLGKAGIALRTFLLAPAPFIDPSEREEWTRRTIDFAVDCGAEVVSIIPTRTGNGAMEELERLGHFAEPGLRAVEDAHDYGVGIRRARVFADLWDLRRFSRCEKCFDARAKRIGQMNLEQSVSPRVACDCG